MEVNMTRDQTIVHLYRDNCARMSDIGQIYGITRQAIYKVLKKQGVDTTKAQRIERKCHTCGKTVLRRRGMIRKTEYSYCSTGCYAVYLETLGEGYRPNNYHARLARRIVEANFSDYDPKKGHTVHHIDKDCEHNSLKNLEVYACQGDHLRKHRGQNISPIWKGIDVS
jgi:endogenous inhibitor of DNA gyrase (YacG/DUF329 family)